MADRAFLYVKRLWAPAIALGAAFSFVIWVLAAPVSAGKIELVGPFAWRSGRAFPLFVIHSILGLALTDPPGLRLQAGFSALTTAINLALSIVLAQALGALGPVLASLVVLFLDGIILAIFLRRRLRTALSPAAIQGANPEN